MICLSSAGVLAWFLVLNEEYCFWALKARWELAPSEITWITSDHFARAPSLRARVFYERSGLQSHWGMAWQRTHRNKHAGRRASRRQLRSKIWWLAEFCNSHCVSHFAAFFIVMGTKISIVENFLCLKWKFCLRFLHRFNKCVHKKFLRHAKQNID